MSEKVQYFIYALREKGHLLFPKNGKNYVFLFDKNNSLYRLINDSKAILKNEARTRKKWMLAVKYAKDEYVLYIREGDKIRILLIYFDGYEYRVENKGIVDAKEWLNKKLDEVLGGV